ncbi:F0F1 ATP synthase subunit A [Desulfonatronum lacustre]|uniref:F0F1 ATP synthase subunit A n=1 Tax=Desulfonatronum lacustre TaxID=66849 RepID=UPI00048D3E91|nr:F0F1 ATP synthase subunit A [Desulfonatronum lacustre]SMP41738.1 ATP synthase F0 subcomplex A subunit [Desulfonatronum zhilinae]
MAGDIQYVLILKEGLDAVGINFPKEYIHIVYSWVIIAVLIFLGWLATRRLTLVPGKSQNVWETLIGGMEDFVVQNMGEAGRKVFPVLFTLFIYILFMNLTGLIPGADAPTANINTNVGMAIFVFLYYNYWGFKLHGLHYIKHFTGPFWWLAPMMLPIEIISHLARPLSLTLRLFGNIRGEEIVIALMFFLAPVLGSLPIFMLFVLMKTMQAFIFFMLSLMYLKGAFEEAH